MFPLNRAVAAATKSSSRIRLALNYSAMATLTESLKKDHQEIKEYHNNYVNASGNNDAQTRWGRQFIWEVARHSVGEEIVVYPLFEKHLGSEGEDMAEHDRASHYKVKVLLAELESLTPGTKEYDGKINQAMENLKEHMTTEEEHDFPRIEEALGETASKSEAKTFERTKMFVPTRSHPSAPDKPPFETLLGLLTAPLDKLQDAFAKFPTEEMKDQSK